MAKPTHGNGGCGLEISICQHLREKTIFHGSVKLNWKYMRYVTVPAIILLCVGCGGLSGSHSVSPGSFFMPGLLKADPNPAPPDATVPETGPVRQIAQVQ